MMQSPKLNWSKALKNLNIISQNMFTGMFHSDQPFTIKSPANLNNISLSIFHSDQSFKDTRFFIRISPSRIQRSMIAGFHSDQPFMIESPANLNNISLSIFHSDQSFKATRFFIQISPSRIQRSINNIRLSFGSALHFIKRLKFEIH